MSTTEEKLNAIRTKLSDIIHETYDLVNDPTVGDGGVISEIVLARRAAEDSRMRLGVAIGRSRGVDPFVDRPDNVH